MVPESLAGDIKFEHVNFRYGTRQRVLEDIDFTIKRAKNCLCWRKRFRKTTLSKLLLHLYQAESGNILINDNNIEDIQIETLRDKSHIYHRKHFCLVVQYLKILHWDWMMQRWMTSSRHQKGAGT